MGHALVLDTGNGTHFTVAYFHRRQPLDAPIFAAARAFCATSQLTHARIELGPMWGARSVRVRGELAQLKAQMVAHFAELGHDVDTSERGVTAHIAIRGDQKLIPVLEGKRVDLVDGWLAM